MTAKSNIDDSVYQRQTIEIAGQKISLMPEAIQPFSFSGSAQLISVTPTKRKHPEAERGDDKVLHIKNKFMIDVNAKIAAEIFGEYLIGALSCRTGDIKKITVAGKVSDMRLRLLNTDDYLEEGATLGKFTLFIYRAGADVKSWRFQVTFECVVMPVNKNMLAVLGEYIGELIPFSCMPSNLSFSFDDEDWLIENSEPVNPKESPLL